MDPDRWEVGGEFDLQPAAEGQVLPWPEPQRWFALAQHALIAVARGFAGDDHILWIPDYFCAPVVDAVVAAGIKIRRYADDPRWAHGRWNTLRPQKGDVVLVVNYFGVRDGVEWREWQDAHRSVRVVEDHTHDPMSTWARTSSADIAIASLRKTMPVPDGAIVWSPRGEPLPEWPSRDDPSGSAMKLAAMAMKSLYLRGEAEIKPLYRQLQLQGESALLATTFLSIAPWSRELLEAGVPLAYRSRRTANVRRLIQATADHSDFRPLFDSWPEGHCPFNAIFVFRNPKARSATLARLIENNVYASVHWPNPDSEHRVRDLSERILTIPVDQRYGPVDVDRVADLLNGARRHRERPKHERSHVRKALTTEVLDGSDPKWDGVLARIPHDIYHTSAFHRLAEQDGAGAARMVVVESGSALYAWPYLLRPVASATGLEASTAMDVGSVYGYPGPLADGNVSSEFLERAHAETHAVWCGQGAVSAFTRFNPILRNQRLVPGGDGIHPVGATVSMDLRKTSDEMMHAYPRVLRQEIQAGRRAGLRTEEDPSWAELPMFVKLYHETMARNHADETYLFTTEDLARLRSNLGEGARLLVTRLGDEIVAGGIFLIYGSRVHAHLVGTASKYRELSPLKVLLDDARSWAVEAGAVRLHLGGGRGGRDDSLLAFKARFSPDRHDFAVGRWILDVTGYEALLRMRATYLGDQPIDGEFFPAYRAEVTPSRVEQQTG